MELLVKPEMLTSYIYRPTFGNVSALPNVGPYIYIYDVSISGFTRSSIYIYDISSLRVNKRDESRELKLLKMIIFPNIFTS